MRRHPVVRPILMLLVGAAPLAAQRPVARLAPRPEFRLVIPATPAPGVLGGIGIEVRAGWYARVAIGAAAGAVQRDDRWQATQQAELSARFLFDPFAERRIGLYGGAGLGISAADGRSSRGELLTLVGVEGAAAGRAATALEVVLGGGVRLRGVLRWRRDVGR